jgi:hypothetical protein
MSQRPGGGHSGEACMTEGDRTTTNAPILAGRSVGGGHKPASARCVTRAERGQQVSAADSLPDQVGTGSQVI